jgi:hypothetical protein
VCLCNVSLGLSVCCIRTRHAIADDFARPADPHDVANSYFVCCADDIRTRHSLVRTTKGGSPPRYGLCIPSSLAENDWLYVTPTV